MLTGGLRSLNIRLKQTPTHLYRYFPSLPLFISLVSTYFPVILDLLGSKYRPGNRLSLPLQTLPQHAGSGLLANAGQQDEQFEQ